MSLQSACAGLPPALVALGRGEDCNDGSQHAAQQAYLELRLDEVMRSDMRIHGAAPLRNAAIIGKILRGIGVRGEYGPTPQSPHRESCLAAAAPASPADPFGTGRTTLCAVPLAAPQELG